MNWCEFKKNIGIRNNIEIFKIRKSHNSILENPGINIIEFFKYFRRISTNTQWIQAENYLNSQTKQTQPVKQRVLSNSRYYSQKHIRFKKGNKLPSQFHKIFLNFQKVFVLVLLIVNSAAVTNWNYDIKSSVSENVLLSIYIVVTALVAVSASVLVTVLVNKVKNNKSWQLWLKFWYIAKPL